jgi:hypothetical protein
MAHSSLLNTIPQRVVNLFKRRGATVGTNSITATSHVTRKTVDREKQKLLVKRGQLTVSG